MDNPFSWGYLTAPIRDVPTFGPFSIAFVVLFVLVFIVAAFMYVRAGARLSDNTILRDAVHNGSQILMWLTGTALFFFAFRLMRVEFLTLYMRIWSYLFLLGLIGFAGYAVYWYRGAYADRRREIEHDRMRRKYQPKAATPRRKARRKARRGIR